MSRQTLSVAEIRQILRTAKLRSTASRVAILQHLDAAGTPLSHAELADALVPAGYDRSTLYRGLIELAEAGLLNRLDAGDHAWRFELRSAGGHEGSEHPHFVCLDCGKVECWPDVTVKISPRKSANLAALGEVTEVFLKGHCNACQ